MTAYDSGAALDLKAATYDEIKARFAELAPVEVAIRDERKALASEIAKRDALARLKVSSMSESDKAALRGALQ